MTQQQQQQPEHNGSTAVAAAEGSSNTRPPLDHPLWLRRALLQACLQSKTLLITLDDVLGVLDPDGSSTTDLAKQLSKVVGKRIRAGGTMASVRDDGDLIILDGMAIMGPGDQYSKLVRCLTTVVPPSRCNRNRLGALLGAGDGAAAPLGRRVVQFARGFAKDLWNDLELDVGQYTRVDSTIGISDAVCSPFVIKQCIETILERAPRDGSAVLLHRHGTEEGTFEGFCRGEVATSAGLDPSQLLRVVSRSNLDLLLDVMVGAEAAALLCDGKVVALGGAIDKEGLLLALFKLKILISTMEGRIEDLKGSHSAFRKRAIEAREKGDKKDALHCMKLVKLYEKEIDRPRQLLATATMQYERLQTARHNLNAIETLEASTRILQEANRRAGVDKVNELMDKIREEQEHLNEISEAFENSADLECDDDDETLLAELEKLVQPKKVEADDENIDGVTDAFALASIEESKKETEGDGEANGAAEQVTVVAEKKPAVVEEAQDKGNQKKMVAAL